MKLICDALPITSKIWPTGRSRNWTWIGMFDFADSFGRRQRVLLRLRLQAARISDGCSSRRRIIVSALSSSSAACWFPGRAAGSAGIRPPPGPTAPISRSASPSRSAAPRPSASPASGRCRSASSRIERGRLAVLEDGLVPVLARGTPARPSGTPSARRSPCTAAAPTVKTVPANRFIVDTDVPVSFARSPLLSAHERQLPHLALELADPRS